MGTFIDRVKQFLRRGDMLLWLIAVNVVLFLLCAIVRVGLTLFNAATPEWLQILDLPASLYALRQRPWTLFTYMFMHASFWHLAMNMLWLWWFGRLFLQFFSARHLRGLYVVSGLAGGCFFVLLYNLFPLFQLVLSQSVLVGASASILGIVVATAVREPEYRISLLPFGTVKLKWMAVATVVMDALLIASSNAGGHIAHLGGALAGWWFASALRRGHDIVEWINKIIDLPFVLMHGWRSLQQYRQERRLHRHRRRVSKSQSTAHRSRQSTERTNSKHADDYAYNASRQQAMNDIDTILAKIKVKGYAGLTEEEKKRLFDASHR